MVEVAVKEAEDRQHLLVIHSPVLNQPLNEPNFSVGQNNFRHTCLSPCRLMHVVLLIRVDSDSCRIN